MLLEVENLTSSYGGLPAIREISLSVAAGEIVAVIGSNGAGKSTLLKSIGGMMRPDGGDVRLSAPVADEAAAARGQPCWRGPGAGGAPAVSAPVGAG